MAQITRTSIIQNFIELLGLQSKEPVPTSLNNNVQLVAEIMPKFSKIQRHVSNTTTSNATVYTTPSDKDFYLTAASLTYLKDATNDCTVYNLAIFQDGVARRVLEFYPLPLTAEKDSRVISFAYPIKVDRGSVVTLVGAFSAGTQTKSATISGFIVE